MSSMPNRAPGPVDMNWTTMKDGIPSLSPGGNSVLTVGLTLLSMILTAQAGSIQVDLAPISQSAQQILELINHTRAGAGAPQLQWDPALAEVAREHGMRMAADGSAEHQYTDEPDISRRAAQSGAHFSLIGEEVAVGSTPANIHEQWMNSPGSRATLLSPQMDHIGIVVIESDGDLYAVAEFEHAVPALTQTQVEATIAGLLQRGGLRVLHDTTTARAVCATDKPFSRAETGRHPGFVSRWQDPDMTHLPPELAELIKTPQYKEAEVGSCPAHDVKGSFTAYRVAVLLY